MKYLKFKLDIIPPTATAQQKGIQVRGGKVHHYKKKKVLDAEMALKNAMMDYVPKEPFDGPVSLTALWIMPKIQRVKKSDGCIWKDTRPDIDNLQKLLKDCMTDLRFWKDDSQVSLETAGKCWGDSVGIEIEIRTLDNEKESFEIWAES